jgi:hypothetical protein
MALEEVSAAFKNVLILFSIFANAEFTVSVSPTSPLPFPEAV